MPTKATTKTAVNTRSRKTTNPKATESTEAQVTTITAKEIDLHQYITVRNGFQGKLVYKSPKTGEHFVWDNFGDEQEMELLELRNAKNSAKRFFINNWFMFDDDWVIDYLGIERYYKNAVKIDEFDDVFKQEPAKIKKTILSLSDGQKKSIAYRAKVLISEGKIDSNRSISAIEEALGLELIER